MVEFSYLLYEDDTVIDQSKISNFWKKTNKSYIRILDSILQKEINILTNC